MPTKKHWSVIAICWLSTVQSISSTLFKIEHVLILLFSFTYFETYSSFFVLWLMRFVSATFSHQFRNILKGSSFQSFAGQLLFEFFMDDGWPETTAHESKGASEWVCEWVTEWKTEWGFERGCCWMHEKEWEPGNEGPRVSEWKNEWQNKCVSERLNERVSPYGGKGTDRWMSEGMNELLTDLWTDWMID